MRVRHIEIAVEFGDRVRKRCSRTERQLEEAMSIKEPKKYKTSAKKIKPVRKTKERIKHEPI